jgi:hypothetical protein
LRHRGTLKIVDQVAISSTNDTSKDRFNSVFYDGVCFLGVSK